MEQIIIDNTYNKSSFEQYLGVALKSLDIQARYTLESSINGIMKYNCFMLGITFTLLAVEVSAEKVELDYDVEEDYAEYVNILVAVMKCLELEDTVDSFKEEVYKNFISYVLTIVPHASKYFNRKIYYQLLFLHFDPTGAFNCSYCSDQLGIILSKLFLTSFLNTLDIRDVFNRKSSGCFVENNISEDSVVFDLLERLYCIAVGEGITKRKVDYPEEISIWDNEHEKDIMNKVLELIGMIALSDKIKSIVSVI